LGGGRSCEGEREHNGGREEWDIRAGMGGTRHGLVEVVEESMRSKKAITGIVHSNPIQGGKYAIAHVDRYFHCELRCGKPTSPEKSPSPSFSPFLLLQPPRPSPRTRKNSI
jgi:hypothetical protein